MSDEEIARLEAVERLLAHNVALGLIVQTPTTIQFTAQATAPITAAVARKPRK